jgi:hypothetical protein
MNRDWSKAYWIDPAGCWLFTGAVSSNGYGAIRNRGAHRWFYEHYVGPIPAGLQIDHLCRVKRCVNPAHLEPVTAQENVRRRPVSLHGAARCKRGHDLSGSNRYEYQRKEGQTEIHCLACQRERGRERRVERNTL